MQSVRFSKIVQTCGKPTIHLVLTAPAKDKELQAAVKAERVMTLFQPSAGHKTDSGQIGFDPGAGRQYLVFPKSLKKFKGRAVVGIKYDALSAPALSKAERAAPPRAHRKKKAVKKKPTKRPQHPKAKSRPAKELAKILQFPRPAEEPDDGSEDIDELKHLVRKAMKSLEQGRQVAAFNLLKRIVEA